MNWTKEEILAYNKRCAEFLEWYYENNKWLKLEPLNGGVIAVLKCNSNIDLKFHSDWNWIMEVVEAIEKKSEYVIMERANYSSFDIGNRNITFYFSPNNKYLLQLELKQVVSDEPWIHSGYKHHIIQQFDFKTKGKKEAVVQAINQFLIWYEKSKRK